MRAWLSLEADIPPTTAAPWLLLFLFLSPAFLLWADHAHISLLSPGFSKRPETGSEGQSSVLGDLSNQLPVAIATDTETFKWKGVGGGDPALEVAE